MTNSDRPLRIVLIGWGAIGQRIAQLLDEKGPKTAKIIAIAVSEASRSRPAFPVDVKILGNPSELLPNSADLVIEVAGREAVSTWAASAITAAPKFVIASTSAFVDDTFASKLVDLAVKADSQIVIPSGALAGIDALVAAGILDLSYVSHSVTKPSKAWMGTEAENLCDLKSLTASIEFCRGSARNIARRFPKNANVAVISAMAGLGLDHTEIRLIADPHAKRNMHHIIAEGAFGRMEVRVENEALVNNPKSSELTALSIFNVIRRESSRIVI
jgi:aspartate dehydrogenase